MMADVKKLIKAEIKKSNITEKKNVTVRLDIELADRYASLKDKFSDAFDGQKLDLNSLVQIAFAELVEAVEEEIQAKKPVKTGTKEKQIEIDGLSK